MEFHGDSSEVIGFVRFGAGRYASSLSRSLTGVAKLTPVNECCGVDGLRGRACKCLIQAGARKRARSLRGQDAAPRPGDGLVPAARDDDNEQEGGAGDQSALESHAPTLRAN